MRIEGVAKCDIVRPDGVVRHVRSVGVLDSDGQGFVGTGIDVTEKDQLTRALRESEEELREILDLTPQLIAVFGPHRERLYANQQRFSSGARRQDRGGRRPRRGGPGRHLGCCRSGAHVRLG
jgi:hypothetical protein